MDCDTCQDQKATIFLTQLVQGKTRKIKLCQACADEKGVTDPEAFGLADELEGVGEEVRSAPPTGEPTCPSCGFTQTDFKKTGRFGCADCYTVFREGLDSLLEAMHKNTRHTGKHPPGRPPAPSGFESAELPGLGEAELSPGQPKSSPGTDPAIAPLGEPGAEPAPGTSGTGSGSLSAPKVGEPDDLERLKAALADSIEAEDYEEAARLRDAIAQLEAQ